MKVNRQMIQMGRVIGVENIGQVKRFVQQLVKTGKGSLHLENDVREAINYARRADAANREAIQLFGLPSSMESLSITRSYFPELFAKGNKTVVDVVAQRVGQSGGVLSVNGATVTPAGEKLSTVSAKVGGNDGGFFFNINSVCGDLIAKAKAIVIPKRSSGASRLDLAKNVKISSENGIEQMTLDPTRTLGIKANANIQAPTDLLDDIVNMGTRGKVPTFADFIKLLPS